MMVVGIIDVRIRSKLHNVSTDYKLCRFPYRGTPSVKNKLPSQLGWNTILGPQNHSFNSSQPVGSWYMWLPAYLDPSLIVHVDI